MKNINLISYALIILGLLTSLSYEKEDGEPEEDYIVYDNHIELEGEDNFRDLGGIECVDGRRILYRKLFRSGELSGLTDEDSIKVAELGIEQIFDLRTPEEIESNPDKVCSCIEAHYFSLFGDLELNSAAILTGEMTTDEYMYQIYTVDSNKTVLWTQIFDLLETGKISLWHCSSGKDRTGMTTALLLHALGADSTTIVENYMESNDYLEENAEEYVESTVEILESYGYNTDAAYSLAEMLKPQLLVELDWIEHFYSSVKEQYGDVDSYLDELGIDRDALRKAYLEK